jgi:hypothetical protein
MKRYLTLILVLLTAVGLSAQRPFPGFGGAVDGGGGAGNIIPTLVFNLPSEGSVESPLLNQTLGGTADPGSFIVDRVTVQCSGATTLAETNATGITTWTKVVTMNTGSTTCTARLYTTATPLVASATQTKPFTIINPDGEAPVVSGGADASTDQATYNRIVGCTDNISCTRLTWSGLGSSGEEDCTFQNGIGTSRNASCDFDLVATSSLTTVNTITLKGYDAQGNTHTDQVAITRTVALAVTSTNLGSCAISVACTGRTATAIGGTGTYTFNNVIGGTTLNDGDAQCAGLSMPVSWNGTAVSFGTPTAAGTCNFQLRVDDGSTTNTVNAVITVVDPGTQTFFEFMADRGESLAISECQTTGDDKGCSLQDSDQLLELAQNTSHTQGYTFDSTFGVDGAAKLNWPNDLQKANGQYTTSIESSISIPLLYQGTDKYLFTWDFWPDSNWRSLACNGVVGATGYTHKEFQFRFDAQGSTGSGPISFELRWQWGDSYGMTCDETATFDLRTYPNGPQTEESLGMNSDTPFNAGTDNTLGEGTEVFNTYAFPHSKWIRFWVEVILNQPHTQFVSWANKYLGGIGNMPTGTYHMISGWVADESNNIKRLFHEIPYRRAVKYFENSTITASGTTATATTSAAHTLVAGDRVEVMGANQAAFNGDFTVVSAPTTTTFTYTMGSAPGTDATGTITISKIRDQLNSFFFEHNTSSNHIRASGFVTLVGSTDGTNIAVGTQLRNPDGEIFQAVCPTELNCNKIAATISGGTASLKVRATDTYGGPAANTAEGTTMTWVSATPTGVTSATVAAGGLAGGDYLLAGDLTAWSRWVTILKNYNLVKGDTAAEDLANNPLIFVRPVP